MIKYIYRQLERLQNHKFIYSSIWTILIIYLSLGRIKNPDPITQLIPHLDKVAHFCMYLILSSLLLFEFQKSTKKNIIVLIMFYSIGIGALMEILQAIFFPYRSGDYFDLLFNSFGSISSLVPYIYYKKAIKK